MSVKIENRKARRKNILRIDCTIQKAEATIARVFDLPEGCIRLVNRSGRKARGDKLVKALIRDWDH